MRGRILESRRGVTETRALYGRYIYGFEGDDVGFGGKADVRSEA
ncbi:MAG: hypothetical protein ABJN22_12065 [Litorimonas sp.]